MMFPWDTEIVCFCFEINFAAPVNDGIFSDKSSISEFCVKCSTSESNIMEHFMSV